MAVSICIPNKSVGGFFSPHTLSSIYYLWIFWWQPFWLVWGNTINLIERKVVFALQNFFFPPFKFECLYVCYFMVFGSTSGSTGSQLERNFASGWIILWVSPICLKWYLDDFKGDAGNRRDFGGWLHGIKLLCMSTRVECMKWMCLFKIHMLRPLGNNQV